jgi:hypothetical protein
MSKLTKRKRDFDKCPSYYEINRTDREKAILNAKNCDPKLKEVKRYDLKR